jgi:Dolichyl-phosphate-mannose-protein mannosyltransferase
VRSSDLYSFEERPLLTTLPRPFLLALLRPRHSIAPPRAVILCIVTGCDLLKHSYQTHYVRTSYAVGVRPAEEAAVRLRRRIDFFCVLFLACTGLALVNAYPGDVHQNTAEIYMWSTLGFKLIYASHPPLLPWIVGALNQLVPVNYFVLAALSAFNVTIAAYAVWRIACLTVGEARAMLVVAIYLLSPYTIWHAVKLDHNAILLSTWPLVVWAFLLSLKDPRWWRGLILGLVSAAAIYGKYTSALLLIAVAVAALASPPYALCCSRDYSSARCAVRSNFARQFASKP